jgi:hypothetical protein
MPAPMQSIILNVNIAPPPPPTLSVHFPALAALSRLAFGPAGGSGSTSRGDTEITATPPFLPCGQYSGDTPETAAARRQRDIIRRDHRVRERAGEEVSDTPNISQLRQGHGSGLLSSLSSALPTSQLDAAFGFTLINFEKPHTPTPVSRQHSTPTYRGRGRSNSIRSRSLSQSRPAFPIILKPYFLCNGCNYPRANRILHTEDFNRKQCSYCMDDDEVEEQDVIKQLVWCIPEDHEAPFSEFWQVEGSGDILYSVWRLPHERGIRLCPHLDSAISN